MSPPPEAEIAIACMPLPSASTQQNVSVGKEIDVSKEPDSLVVGISGGID